MQFSIILAVTLWFGQPHGSLAVWWNAHWPYLRQLAIRKNISAAIQAIGALVTFYGLLRAYLRATYNQTVTERITSWVTKAWGRLLKLPQTITLSGIPSSAAFGRLGITQTPPPHNVDITQNLHEQIKRLAQYVHDRTDESSKMALDITKLTLEVDGVKDAVSELECKMREHTTSEIQAFDNKLDSKQALDLTWAIWGILVSFVGTVLSLGT
ncbi:hypothetical protein X011_25580 [Mycobacterium tuberculosis variant microti OV254]|nr:hypothetical protein X011_25580 [Mycobacterium tuberculosis variant microti OV254]BBX38911.1 hypothetical protein MSIM_03620 [Mycobacterium simiae]